MYPIITVFGRKISTYMICVLVGGIAAAAVLFRESHHGKYRRDQIVHILLAAAGGAFVGGHLFFVFSRIEALGSIIENSGEYFSSVKGCLNAFLQLFGGMIYYGGLIGGIVGAALYLRSQRMNFTLYADLFAPIIPLFHCFGRIGCFFSGCCYGYRSKYGVVFYNELTHMPGKEARFPIQLVEAALNLLIFAVLLMIFKKKKAIACVLPLYFLIYCPVRFVLEFFRGDIERGLYFGLSTSQWLSIILLVIALALLVRLKKTKKSIDKV